MSCLLRIESFLFLSCCKLFLPSSYVELLKCSASGDGVYFISSCSSIFGYQLLHRSLGYVYSVTTLILSRNAVCLSSTILLFCFAYGLYSYVLQYSSILVGSCRKLIRFVSCTLHISELRTTTGSLGYCYS